MHCTLVNHSYVNEIQTITQLFFPNARFTFSFDAKTMDTNAMEANAMDTNAVDTNAVDAKTMDTNENTNENTNANTDTRSDAIPAQGYAVLSVLDDSVCENTCIGAVYKDAERVAFHALSQTPDLNLSLKRLLMLALFHALKQVFDAYTPWGALTGIRPSKLVRQWLADGQTDRQIITALTQTYQCHENKARLAVAVAHTENRLDRVIVKTAAQAAPGKVPIGLYVSVPFCPSRCLYCSFNTMHKPVGPDKQAAYLTALAAECAVKARAIAETNSVITTLYIGGGTPTVLSEPLLATLLEMVSAHFAPYMCAQPEYTVEAGRPDSVTPQKLRLLKDHGVNRIAVNPQTLQDRTLEAIGRNHTARDFFAAFDMARAAGFERINTDVIAGLPGESPADMAHTMAGLAALSPENITVHTLAVKRASRLNEQLADYVPPGVAAIEHMLSIAQETCLAAGLNPYYLYRQKNMVGLLENVGYSKPGCECLYNISMMAETQTVLAVGAGAVSKYVAGTLITRSFNVKNADVYVARKALANTANTANAADTANIANAANTANIVNTANTANTERKCP